MQPAQNSARGVDNFIISPSSLLLLFPLNGKFMRHRILLFLGEEGKKLDQAFRSLISALDEYSEEESPFKKNIYGLRAA